MGFSQGRKDVIKKGDKCVCFGVGTQETKVWKNVWGHLLVDKHLFSSWLLPLFWFLFKFFYTVGNEREVLWVVEVFIRRLTFKGRAMQCKRFCFNTVWIQGHLNWQVIGMCYSPHLYLWGSLLFCCSQNLATDNASLSVCNILSKDFWRQWSSARDCVKREL